MKHIWKIAAVVLAVMTVASCDNKKFTVEGQITNAKDSVLYFENVGLEGINVIDSVTLADNGHFSFDGEAPAAPEFYRLRIADQIINVSIDSTETVNVNAQMHTSKLLGHETEIDGIVSSMSPPMGMVCVTMPSPKVVWLTRSPVRKSTARPRS